MVCLFVGSAFPPHTMGAAAKVAQLKPDIQSCAWSRQSQMRLRHPYDFDIGDRRARQQHAGRFHADESGADDLGEIVLDRPFDSLMRIPIENAGAAWLPPGCQTVASCAFLQPTPSKALTKSKALFIQTGIVTYVAHP